MSEIGEVLGCAIFVCCLMLCLMMTGQEVRALYMHHPHMFTILRHCFTDWECHVHGRRV